MLAYRAALWYNTLNKGGMPVSALDARKPRESKVMKIVNFAGTAVMLNMLFLLACIPVVTIGPAFSGLYSGVRYMIRGDGAIRGFRDGFKTNPLRTVPAGIVMTQYV